MTVLLVPADPVRLAIDWLAQPNAYPWPVSVTNTAPPPASQSPNPQSGRVVLIRRTGGVQGRDLHVVDQAWLTVEAFAATPFITAELAHRTYGVLRAMAGQQVSGTTCYRVQTVAAPASVPADEGVTPRFVFTVQAGFRMNVDTL